MKLHIEWFAKISSADIEFDGMTVIAGKNNTGKSTVGKVLYAFFRSMSQLEKRVRRDRLSSIMRAFKKATDFSISESQAESLLVGSVTERRLYDDMLGALPDYERNMRMLALPGFSAADERKLAAEIEQARKADGTAIAGRLIGKVLDCVFHHQYAPLKGQGTTSRIVLTVQGMENTLTIRDGGFEAMRHINLTNKVHFVASPDVLSLLNVRDIETSEHYERAFDKYTLELAQSLVKKSPLSATEEEALQAKLREIYEVLDLVIGGDFKPDKDNEFALYEKGNDRPTKAENLSMGLKSFVLLRHMLQQGVLQDRDVLILDEPENHLHPTLQIVYAQVLVLLQKHFNLTILVTSHSAFFVNALQRFGLKELATGRMHFYLSKEDVETNGFVTFDDVTKKTGPIFKGFTEAYALADRLSGADMPEDADL